MDTRLYRVQLHIIYRTPQKKITSRAFNRYDIEYLYHCHARGRRQSPIPTPRERTNPTNLPRRIRASAALKLDRKVSLNGLRSQARAQAMLFRYLHRCSSTFLLIARLAWFHTVSDFGLGAFSGINPKDRLPNCYVGFL